MDKISEIQDETSDKKGIRIAKIIAQSGRCSRREAEAMITEGRVQVNGRSAAVIA